MVRLNSLIRWPLRFKLTLVCLLGLAILGVGSVVLFTRAWVDLSRAYGLLTINRRLENLEATGTSLEAGEWAAEIEGSASGTLALRWIKSPPGFAAASLDAAAVKLTQAIARTRLASGSFEMSLDDTRTDATYFVAFGEHGGKRAVAGTGAHRSLWDLSPWAAPFVGFLIAAIVVTTGLILTMTARLTRAYGLLSKAMRDVGAGRFENLQLPEDNDRSIAELSDSLRDMSMVLDAKEKKIAEVSQLADEDPMTGMKNYRAFTNYMNTLLSKGKARGTTFPVLAIVDLDFFKKVNDNYGHQTGDFVLRHTSKLIKAAVRMDLTQMPDRLPDFCGRYGGEEFVVIFSQSQERSMHLAPMRLMQAIKTTKLRVPKEINEKGEEFDLTVSASIGIAAWDPARFSSKEEWIKEADAALYEAKRRGRARLVRIVPQLQEWV